VESYDELRLRFTRAGDAYTVLATSPDGEATAPFALTASPLELENLVLRVSRSRRGVRRVDSPELELVRRFGGELFASVFTGSVRDLYREAVGAARSRGHGVRITLSLDETPELMHVPWEYLYQEPFFLAISTWTPVVRSLEIPDARRPLAITPPLRILAMVSSPTDVVGLDVALERRKLEEALAESIGRGAVEIEWLEQATLAALQRALRRANHHVFHFVGHGVYDAEREDGLLLLEDDDGRSRSVSGVHLGTMLADEWSLRLAVLNACEGARTSTSDPFAGVAASLMQREIPAVVAMQFEITDRAAIVFAAEFYAAVADGYAVDAALAEARKAIYADGNDIEWATPVLFMRAAEGLIFDVAEPAPRPAPREREPEREGDPAVEPGGGAEAVVEPADEAAAEPWDEPEPSPEVEAESEPWDELAPEPWDELEAEPPAQPVPRPAAGAAAVPVDAVAAVLAAALVLTAALFVRWEDKDDLWTSFYDDSATATTGLLAPLALPLGALGALALALRGARSLAAGLLVGLGLSGAALHGGVAMRIDGLAEGTANLPFFVLAAVAGLVVAAAGARLALREGPDPPARWPGAALAGAAAVAGALLVAGLFVDFNGGGADEAAAAIRPDRVQDEPWATLHALLVALGAGAALLVASLGRRRLAGGLLTALGTVGALVWLRYALVPIDLADGKGSAAPGGFVGLAGALVVLGAGAVLVRSASEPTAAPPGRGAGESRAGVS
jgi:hypothetical protein